MKGMGAVQSKLDGKIRDKMQRSASPERSSKGPREPTD